MGTELFLYNIMHYTHYINFFIYVYINFIKTLYIMVSGKFTLTGKDADNFDKYMAAVGVGLILRKAAKHMSQNVELIETANGVQVITTSSVKSSNETFEFGVEKDVTTMDGRKTKSTMTKKGDGYLLTEKWNGKTASIDIYIDGEGQLVFDLSSEGNKLCHRVYKKD